MKVLITGAAGFLGSHLAEHYLHLGAEVVGVDNFITGQKNNIATLKHKYPNSFHFFDADVISEWGWLPKDFQAQYVFHMASPASPPHYMKAPLETLWVNSIGLSKALDVANSMGARLIYASTSEIYGDPLQHPQTETYYGNVNSFGPRSCYDEGKRFGEALIYTNNQILSGQKMGPRHGLVRIFNTYGPRMNPTDGRVVVNLLKQAIEGAALTVYGTGLQTRSFCYVSDLISGLTKYAELPLYQPLNLGNDREFTILELVAEIQNLFPKKQLVVQHLEKTADDPQQRRPDLTQTKKLLSPWSPTMHLKDGLAAMKLWMETL